jgi:SAM-dependent methyltransferase
MHTIDPRLQWGQQAPIYASDEGHRRFGRFVDLYEESCWRYIEPMLPEIEGSFGRLVVSLAPMGYRMVLSDLSPEMIRYARDKVERLGLSNRVASYHVLDICDMHALSEYSFDMVLALGGPLSLCRDAKLAVNGFRRLTKPGGYAICDTANRYRTALDLVRDNEMSQLVKVLDTGQFSRPDGLTDHRFDPQELVDLFKANEMEAIHVAGICPLFDYLPTKEHASMLDNERVFEMMLDVGRRYAEDPYVVGLSGRLLIVAQRRGKE